MNSILKISTMALLAGMLATAPAGAASLLNVGGNSDSNAAINVDTGNLLGTGGSGSGSSNTGVSVDLGTGGGGGSGSNGSVVDVNLGGSGSGDLLDLSGSNGVDANVNVDLGGSGDGTLVDLFGTGTNDPITADVNIGGSGGADANLLLDLFGNGDNPDASVTVDSGNGAGDVAGLGSPGASVTVDLFGNDGVGGGGGSGGGNGSGGSGGGSGNGNGLGAGSGSGGTGGLGAGGNGVGGPGVRIASANASAKCFTPNTQQMTKLVARHTYGPETFSSWTQIGSLKIVKIGLCNSAAAQISGQANIGKLQAFINSNAVIRAGLAKAGHSPGDVIAVDKKGTTLILYVA